VKVGDLVKHNVTGFVALVLSVPPPGLETRVGMMNVMTIEGPGRWCQSNCEVVSESR